MWIKVGLQYTGQLYVLEGNMLLYTNIKVVGYHGYARQKI